MNPSWDDLPIHVIDFEGGPHCGIVEFGVVTLNGQRIVSSSTRLCRPKARISRKEQATHGIANEDVRDASSFMDEWERFAGLRESGPLAAHFAAAENTMLRSAFPFPRSSTDWADVGRKVVDWGPWIDTGYLYRNYGDGPGSLKLEDLILHWGLQRELDELASQHCPVGRRSYHCALYDALASALLLLLYCCELDGERPTVRQLIIGSQGSGAKKQGMEQQQLF